MKKIVYVLEALALSLFFLMMRILPLDISSWIGGFLGRAIGPVFSANKTAKKNIAAAFPHFAPEKVERTVVAMWEHLGRVGAEYPSLPGRRLSSRIALKGTENLPKPGEAAFIFTGHIGNWELICPVNHNNGVDFSIVYRHTNNPYVDKIIAKIRKSNATDVIAKGIRGGIRILGTLKRGGTVGMLVDQKQNNGIPIPFFGRDAMTSPAIAEIALKYNVPLIPLRVVRTKGAHFEVTVYPPLTFEKTGDHKEDVRTLMIQISSILEGWIREIPEQWFWVHRRWPKA